MDYKEFDFGFPAKNIENSSETLPKTFLALMLLKYLKISKFN